MGLPGWPQLIAVDETGWVRKSIRREKAERGVSSCVAKKNKKQNSLGTKIWDKSWETLDSNGARTGPVHGPSHSTHSHAHPEENESDPRVSGWDEEGQRRNENKLSVTYSISAWQMSSLGVDWGHHTETKPSASVKRRLLHLKSGSNSNTTAFMCNTSCVWEWRTKHIEGRVSGESVGASNNDFHTLTDI